MTPQSDIQNPTQLIADMEKFLDSALEPAPGEASLQRLQRTFITAHYSLDGLEHTEAELDTIRQEILKAYPFRPQVIDTGEKAITTYTVAHAEEWRELRSLAGYNEPVY